MHVKCLDQYWNSLICDKVGLRDQKLRRRRRLRGRSRATLPEKHYFSFLHRHVQCVCLFVCFVLSLSLPPPLSLIFSSPFVFPISRPIEGHEPIIEAHARREIGLEANESKPCSRVVITEAVTFALCSIFRAWFDLHWRRLWVRLSVALGRKLSVGGIKS